MRRLLATHELYIALSLVVLSLVIGGLNDAFFTWSNVFDLLKSSVVVGMLALGVLVVLVSGGIDISFTAVAAFSMYVTSKLLVAAEFSGLALWAFLLAGAIGLGLGLINAFFISCFNLPTLIVTLGTAGAFRGFMLAFIGTENINNLPAGLVAFSRWNLFERTLPTGERIGLSVSVILFLAVALLVGLGLRYTMAGRSVYALGGNESAAARAGIPLGRLRFGIYGLVGFLSGLAGIVHASLMRNAKPFDLVGSELVVIAAVVLGGASITGGRGSVTGTVLGVFLLVTIQGSLLLMGIPSYWQKVLVGAVILGSTAISARRQ
jgi:simple sugar transport system permease protein